MRKKKWGEVVKNERKGQSAGERAADPDPTCSVDVFSGRSTV